MRVSSPSVVSQVTLCQSWEARVRSPAEERGRKPGWYACVRWPHCALKVDRRWRLGLQRRREWHLRWNGLALGASERLSLLAVSSWPTSQFAMSDLNTKTDRQRAEDTVESLDVVFFFSLSVMANQADPGRSTDGWVTAPLRIRRQ